MKRIYEMRGKKGIAVLFIILFIILALIVIYCFLFIPIPAFTKVRMIINYFLIIILWFVLQAGLIWCYVKAGSYVEKSIFTIRTKVMNWSSKIQYYIAVHS